MKKENFLARLRPSANEDPNEYFILTRGERIEVEGLTGLALVRASIPEDTLVFKGEWSIIDIDSGLFVIKDNSKKKLLEKWLYRLNNPDYDLVNRILKARLTDSYKKHKRLKEDEADIWRRSGYLIEGR